VQALALLSLIKGRKLVVAPSSLLFNWQREAERFLPGVRILVLSGGQRHGKFAHGWGESELVITSYPLLRLDAERLCAEKFAAVILDEAQHIKNPDSQAAQAAYRLRSERRFVLTGTPVENAVRDVWSLLHFLMPGYLGSRADFKERYEQPVAQEPGGPEHRRMIQRLSPFVLRRTKKAVAPELPDKIEQVVWCELSGAQREAYARLVDLSRREVSKAEGLKNQGQARMLMLTALLRLRQACNDLRLLGEGFESPPGKNAADEPAHESAKLNALDELLTEAIHGGHRVLLFSQFATMLDLLQIWLEERQIAFCRLDGSTRDRTTQVDRFQTGTVPIFLISLKAGGVGLNLTAADTVVHFDPWWNPAVEAQATDRAHRIGQKSTVTSYKLITRGTVEEKILQLQQRKRSLMDALVESEQPLMDGLTMDDIAGLLES
jgi:SNF2 family DNA or RNA helicase